MFHRLCYRFFSFENHFLALGLRCGHHGRQQGLRFHASRSSQSLMICSFLVSSFLTIVTQQIHSLRASGVSDSRLLRTSGWFFSVVSKSSGKSWRKSVICSEWVMVYWIDKELSYSLSVFCCSFWLEQNYFLIFSDYSKNQTFWHKGSNLFWRKVGYCYYLFS